MVVLTDDEKRKNIFILRQTREKLKTLYNENKLEFGRGLFEASEEDFDKLFNDIKTFYNERGIQPVISRKVITEIQHNKETGYPNLIYGGQNITVTCKLYPTDNNGTTKMKQEVLDEMRELLLKENKIKEMLEDSIDGDI